jgi:hypothetical protein
MKPQLESETKEKDTPKQERAEGEMPHDPASKGYVQTAQPGPSGPRSLKDQC